MFDKVLFYWNVIKELCNSATKILSICPEASASFLCLVWPTRRAHVWLLGSEKGLLALCLQMQPDLQFLR